MKNNADTTERFREYEKTRRRNRRVKKGKEELAKVVAQLEEIQANTTVGLHEIC